MISISVILFYFTFISYSYASYFYSISSEKCAQQTSGEELFQFLNKDCTTYDSKPMEMYCFNTTEVQESLESIPEWTFVKNNETGDYIIRTFYFQDFKKAFLWMAQSAQLAEKNDHHPDWSNMYNTVFVKLFTDDTACLSSFDFLLARGMDRIYEKI